MKRVAVALLALIALACGGAEAISTRPLTEGGTYDLTSIDGTALPFPTDVTEAITSGSLALDADTHAWSMDEERSRFGQPFSSLTLSGSYTLSGNILTLTVPMGGSLAGSYALQTITVPRYGRTFLFTRR